MADIRVFGSVARGQDTDSSDLDLLMRVPEGTGLLALGRFTQELEDLLHVPVEVVPDDSVKPRVRDGIDRDPLPLRAAATETDWSTPARRARPWPSTCTAARSATGWSARRSSARRRDRRGPSGTLRSRRSQQPSVPWPRVAAVRDQLTHRYLGFSHAIVGQTGGADLAELLAATESLLAVLDAPD
jgi:predicted nucleotidyltransferase